MTKRRFITILCLSALTLAACGGEDAPGDGPSTRSSSAATDPTAARAEALESCLAGAGLEVSRPDALFFGVEVDYTRLEVALDSETFDEAYTADVVAFASEQDALDSRPAITLQNEDDQRNKVIGEVLVAYSIVPDPEDAEQVEGCVTA